MSASYSVFDHMRLGWDFVDIFQSFHRSSSLLALLFSDLSFKWYDNIGEKEIDSMMKKYGYVIVRQDWPETCSRNQQVFLTLKDFKEYIAKIQANGRSTQVK
jgi:hypothetical protein